MDRLTRFITCGSVDDGKSTLIGRLLHESAQIHDDQMVALAKDSSTHGTQGDDLDFALLLDGLQSEREQGITIDVAYRHFATPSRRFLIADCPGHEQYTRNMVTAASTADAAVILIDARKGVLPQTRRHSTIVSLLGVPHVIVAVNKMDLVDWSPSVFEAIEDDFLRMASQLRFDRIEFIPISALQGDNVVTSSSNAPWHQGRTLVEALESVELPPPPDDRQLRLPVQLVVRPSLDFRGLAGTIASGSLRVGQRVRILPSRVTSEISTIRTARGDAQAAGSGDSVMITLADEVDAARGDVLVSIDGDCETADRLRADMVWMHSDSLECSRSYLMKISSRTVTCTISPRLRAIDITSLESRPVETLHMNDVAEVVIDTRTSIPFEKYSTCRELGSFVLIDRYSYATLAAGMLRSSIPNERNVVRPQLKIDKVDRSSIKSHKPAIVWLTGLSGAGKSTIADLVEQRLATLGVHTYLLDGDNLRFGLNRDLGFTIDDRSENIRRAGEVAALMVDAGLIVLASFISPFAKERNRVRELVGDSEYFEIHVHAPLEEAERRDPKGLYARARAGEIPDFTGIDSAYEPPESPDLFLDTTLLSPDESATTIVRLLVERGIIEA